MKASLELKTNTLKSFEKRLNTIVKRMPIESEDAVSSLTNKIYAESQRRVPVRSGALKASGRIAGSNTNGNVITMKIIYGDDKIGSGNTATSEYAIKVHENAKNFKGYKYLEKSLLNKDDLLIGLARRILNNL